MNSERNHNRCSTARREATDELVARKADGTPLDHIKDLTRAQQGRRTSVRSSGRRWNDCQRG
ncbi:polymorphic toxin type 28 domain-containing protein [Streptomyces sp. NPDC002809]|uniref:polymorphic toxin type 28 domain-containing protein n=1 Tax=Streptomyces sp. NPDC002809 TaxID=3154433 RepID=UPI00332ACC25